ncbi:MAG: enoyl-CoA hydratase-related protein [Hyphomonadaceae bacterium]
MDDLILYDVDDFVATITFNNPSKLNASTPKMDTLFHACVKRAAADEKVRAIVLTGAGQRAFCAGADINTLREQASGTAANAAGAEQSEQISDDLTYFTRIPKPVIAALNGSSAGVGSAIAIFSDYRFIVENAKFTTTFARRGLVAEFGIAWMLARQIGIMNALDVLSARPLSGVEVSQLGLARLLPTEGFLAHVQSFARDLAKNTSPRSFGIVKRQLYESFNQDLQHARALAFDEAMKSFDSEDFVEGVAYFLEKRAPNFTGR